MTPMQTADQPKQASPAAAERKRPRQIQELGLMGVLILLAAILTAFSGSVEVRRPGSGVVIRENRFLRGDNLDKLAKNASFFAIMATGATLVIITGGIDLSVGAVYCLAA